MRVALGAAALVALAQAAKAYYLPGIEPNAFKKGEEIIVWANELNSRDSALAFDYRHYDFCQHKPGDGPKDPPSNLGQRLFGDRLEPIPYTVRMLENVRCTEVCSRSYTGSTKKDAKAVSTLIEAMKEEYYQHWVIDGLDALVKNVQDKPFYVQTIGFPVGAPFGDAKDNQYFLLNHINITIQYHTVKKSDTNENVYRVVGASVDVRSQQSCDAPNDYVVISPLTKDDDKLTLHWTYEVNFVENPDLEWGSRLDTYLAVQDEKIRWLSIANSIVIIVFLSFMVAMILMRTVYRDIARYNRVPTSEKEDEEADMEETGWKLVHGDVFRPPQYPLVLSALIGSGVQVLMMGGSCLLFSFLHLISPMRRGSIMTFAVVLFVCLGAPAGYVAARLYKMMGGEYWKATTIATAFLVPGTIFGLFFINNTVLWAEGSSNHVNFITMLSLVSLWFLVSVPFTFFGSYLAFKKPAIEPPVRVNQIPRQIPTQPIYMRPIPAIMIGGILPFGAIFIELFFILSSLWYHRLYYLPVFLFVVYGVLVIICAEVSVLLIYFQLCLEDYHWWWRSFLMSGSTAFYLFLYSIFYFLTQLTFHGFVNTFLYFGFSLMISILLFVMTGCVGHLACIWFVRKIYSSVKID